MTNRDDRWGISSLLYNNKHPFFFLLAYQKKYWPFLLSYKTNWQPLLVLSYRTNCQFFSVSFNYKYKSQFFFAHPVYEDQCWLGFNKDTVRKSMLDHLVDIKPLLHKESNKSNIP